MNEMHIDFELEFEDKPVVFRYGIVIARQLQLSLIISSTALWPSSLPCLYATCSSITRIPLDGNSCNFILVNTLKIGRDNSNFIKLFQRIICTVLGDRYTVFQQVSIKNLWKENSRSVLYRKLETFIPLIKFLRNNEIYMILWKIMLNRTGHSALCVVDNLGDSRKHIM